MSKKAGFLYHPVNNHPEEIFEGFSWPCLFFGPFWYLVKGVYVWAAAILVVAGYALPFFIPYYHLFQLVAQLVFAFFANNHRTESLLKKGYLTAEEYEKTTGSKINDLEYNNIKKSDYKWMFALSIMITVNSLFLPYYYIGSTSVSLLSLADLTKGINFDIIGAALLFISPLLMLIIGKNLIMASGIFSGLGLLLVLNRAIKISSAGNDFGSFNPSIGPGLILFGIAAIIQLIGIASENSKTVENKDIDEKKIRPEDKAGKSDQSLKDGDIPHEIEKLAKLKEQGILTEEEFKEKKKE